MITTFKTKKEVVVNSRTSEEAIVYLDVFEVRWNGEKWIADCQYYYFKNNARTIIEFVQAEFTNEEADAIENQLTMEGTTWQRLFTLCITATQMQIGGNGYFNTPPADWEMYYPPVEEPVEEITEG